MAITARRIPNEPIIIVKYHAPHTPPNEQLIETSEKVSALMRDITGPVYRINDITEYNLSFADMVVGMAEEAKRGLPGTLSDPRIQTITVGTDELIKFGTEAAKQEQYGEIDIKLFTSLDEAIAHAREVIAQGG